MQKSTAKIIAKNSHDFLSSTQRFLCFFVDFRVTEYAPAKSTKKLIARNRKRKNGKIEYKKIPVPKQAQELIEWNKPLTADLHRLKINDMMKDLLAGKTAYCLRHTFATFCQQYVRPDIVDIRMGDSPQRLVGKVYTHFPDDFMKKQMDLVISPTPTKK